LALSIELGKKKCLVILGVSQEYYIEEVRKNRRGLTHQDVEVLKLEIMRVQPLVDEENKKC